MSSEGFATDRARPAVVLSVAGFRGVPEDADLGAAVRQGIARCREALPGDVALELAADLAHDRFVLVEALVPWGTRPEAVRLGADRLADALGAATRSRCVCLRTGPGEPVRVLLVGGAEPAELAAVRKVFDAFPDVQLRACQVAGPIAPPPFPVHLALCGPHRAALREWAEAVTRRVTADGAAADPWAFPRTDGPVAAPAAGPQPGAAPPPGPRMALPGFDGLDVPGVAAAGAILAAVPLRLLPRGPRLRLAAAGDDRRGLGHPVPGRRRSRARAAQTAQGLPGPSA